MKKILIIIAASIAVLVLIGFFVGRSIVRSESNPDKPIESVFTPSTDGTGDPYEGFLYGRVTTHGGESYEGPLRWGGNQEAFWGDHFHGVKTENRWAEQVPEGQLPVEHSGIEIFGTTFGGEERPVSVERIFMARFGDIRQIEVSGKASGASRYAGDVRVTLKSGPSFLLERMDASDFDDGVRVWDRKGDVVDLDARQIRLIEFLPAPELSGAPERLHGVVRTSEGEFEGYLQWDREEALGIDTLEGRTSSEEVSLRFDSIASIERQSGENAAVTLRDGTRMVLSGGSDVASRNRGIYVDDLRFGRVLIYWGAFERVDFTPAGSGPGYDDFPPGEPLQGSVQLRDGSRLEGRLVYDLDESETTETLDAQAGAFSYTIPFGLVASIARSAATETAPDRVVVSLHNGEELQVERSGDLGDRNAGMLVFAAGAERPQYVSWPEIARIEFTKPSQMYPPISGE